MGTDAKKVPCTLHSSIATANTPEAYIAERLACVSINGCKACDATIEHREAMMPGITDRAMPLAKKRIEALTAPAPKK